MIRTANVNGTELGYEVRGDGSLPPLLFVHGYGLRGTGEEVYGPLLRRLAQHFTVYALDLRGHGRSAMSIEGWTLEALADDVVAFALKQGMAGCHYVGHSLGGFTGMLAEIRHPGTFRTLSLLATSPAIGGRDTREEIGQTFIANSRNPDLMSEAFAPFFVRPAPVALRTAALLAGLMDWRVHRAFFTEFAKARISDELRSVTLPVLAINGRLDVVIDPEEQHRTALGLVDCKEIILPNEGHMLPIEATESVAEEIIRFCNARSG